MHNYMSSCVNQCALTYAGKQQFVSCKSLFSALITPAHFLSVQAHELHHSSQNIVPSEPTRCLGDVLLLYALLREALI